MSEKITYVKRDDSDREGNALKTKDGRPYTRMTLKVESKGDRYISGFGSASNKDWKVGDEVDIIITEAEKTDKEGKPYLNFSQPKAATSNPDERIGKILTELTFIKLTLQQILQYVEPKKKGVPYPKNEFSEEAFPEEDAPAF